MSRLIVVECWGKRYKIDLVEIDEEGHDLDAPAAAAWFAMVEAARKDAVYLTVRTAFRSREFQQKLRNAHEIYQTYLRDVLAWERTGGAAPVKVPWAALAARPGSSEHEVGRAVDIERHIDRPVITAQIDGWLADRAKEFGWILDVKDSSGKVIEPWHYGYRGVPLVIA